MGTDVKNEVLRGILVPDNRLAIWDDESGEYAAGVKVTGIHSMSPVAGIPEPDNSTSMGLRATGAQETEIYIRTNRGGLPSIDGCGMLWSDTSGSNYRGCDLPNVCTAFEPLPQSGVTHLSPHIARLPNDKLMIAYWDDSVEVAVRVRDPDSETWGAAVAVHTEAANNPRPCLQVTPGGRVHLYVYETLDANKLQIRLYYSDDDGATWSNAGFVLSDAIDRAVYTDFFRIRTGYLNGQMLMLLHLELDGGTYTDVLSQWASSDGGHTFEEVYTQDGTDIENAGASPEIVIDQGVFLVGFLRIGSTDEVYAEFRRLGTAFYRFDYTKVLGDTLDRDSGNDWGNVNTGVIEHPYFAFWGDDDGSLYCTGVDYFSGSAPILRSADHAETWLGTGTSASFTSLGQTWWNAGDTDYIPVDFAAVSFRGKSLVISNFVRNATQRDALVLFYLGGWQTNTMANRTYIQKPTHRKGWENHGYSCYEPDEPAVWTASGAGTASIDADIFLNLVSTAVAAIEYYVVPTTTLFQGLNAEFTVKREPGVGTNPRMILRISDATPECYGIYCEIDGTTAYLYDYISSTLIGSVTLPDSDSDFYRIRMAIQDDNGRAWIAPDDTDADTDWTEIGSSSSLTDSGVNSGNLIQFGQPIGAGESYWKEWHYSEGAYTSALMWTAGQANENKYPRNVISSPVWFGENVRLSADTGPTVAGDTWTITPTAEYPLENLDPRTAPSPKRTWRSRLSSEMSPLTDEIRIAYSLSTIVEYGMSDLWALWLQGVNCAEIEIYLYYGGAWNLVDTTKVDQFSGTRAGGTVRANPAGATSGSAKWRRGELDGAGIEFVTLPLASDWTGKITENRQGSTVISGAVNSVRFAATIEGWTGALSASPTVRIWPKRHLVLMNLANFANEIRGVQIRIPRQAVGTATKPGNPYDGYFEIGKLVVGPVWVWGHDYSNGRSITYQLKQDVTEAEDGTRTVRALAPMRRVVELSWADGTDTCNYQNEDLPDYTSFADSNPAVALVHDTPLDIVDEIRQLQGAATPVVYLPSMPRNTAGGYEKWGQGAVYGRIVQSETSLDTIFGEEEDSEIFRLSRLVIEEEI